VSFAYRIVRGGEDMKRALDTLQAADAGTQEAMRESSRLAVSTTWTGALASATGTKPEQRMLVDGSTVDIHDDGFTVTAGMGGPLSGGLTNDHWPAIEFGMTPKQVTSSRRKTVRIAGTGRTMQTSYLVWVGMNLRDRNPDGYVILPTLREHGPRFVAAWVYGLIDLLRGGPLDIKKD